MFDLWTYDCKIINNTEKLNKTGKEERILIKNYQIYIVLWHKNRKKVQDVRRGFTILLKIIFVETCSKQEKNNVLSLFTDRILRQIPSCYGVHLCVKMDIYK